MFFDQLSIPFLPETDEIGILVAEFVHLGRVLLLPLVSLLPLLLLSLLDLLLSLLPSKHVLLEDIISPALQRLLVRGYHS